MKTLRLFTIAVLAVLVMSTWAPFPVYAQPSTTTTVNFDLATVKLAKLRVTNKTGGTLYVKFTSATNNYFFAAPKQGKTTFTPATIKPGKYTITVTSSGCGGSLTYHKKVNGGIVGLPTIVCRH
jgi:hypothetical protein